MNLKGQGGKESEFVKILSTTDGWVRRNGNLFDYENIITGVLVEIKKQQDTQWFDPSKYFNLTTKEKEITMLFCLTDSKGGVTKIFTIRTEDFILRNFSQDFLKDCYELKLKYNDVQVKKSVSIKKFLTNNSDIVNIIWEK